MAKRWGLAIVLVVASAAMSADPPAAPRIERRPEFVRRLNTAVDHGVAWLRKAQAADGSFADFPTFEGATTALAYHTLRACGVPRIDGCTDRAWTALRRGYRKESLKTYSAAVYLMAIASHGDSISNPSDDRDVGLSPDDASWASEVARCLTSAQDGDGGWSYDVDARPADGDVAGRRRRADQDHSNTQYALLGLKCAARCGVVVDPSVWKKSLVHFLAAQEQTGPEVARGSGAENSRSSDRRAAAARIVDRARGWGYMQSPPAASFQARPTVSMTAGGVSSVVICRSELLGTLDMRWKLAAESERAIWDGLAWLGATWRPNRRGDTSSAETDDAKRRVGSPPPVFDPYEAYGVERAGVFAGVEWMGDLDWYGSGAAPILDQQAKDGSWSGVHTGLIVSDAAAAETARHVIDTCFALLFLKRGTTPVHRGGVVTEIGDDLDVNFAAAATLTGRDLDDFFDLVLSHWRRATDDAVRTRLFDGATAVGPRIVEPLLVRMDAPDADDRVAAHALLAYATGLDFGYAANAEQDAREAAIQRWQVWWTTSKDRLVYEPASRRLVVR